MPQKSPKQQRFGWICVFLVNTMLTSVVVDAAENDAIVARAERIANLSVVEKRELLARQERFNQLSDDEQEKLRRFHDELSAHPDAEKLKKVLESYVTWLSTQNANEQAQLQQLPIDRRLDRIVELNHDRDDRRLEKLGLTADDANIILDWFVSSVDSNRENLTEALGISKSQNGKKFDSRQLRMMIMRHMGDVLDLLPTNALISQLSSKARESFYADDNPGKQRKQLEKWIQVSFQHRFRPPPISRAELFRRLRDKPPEQRARLEQLPPDQLEDVLRREFASWPRRHPGYYRRQRSDDQERRAHGSRRLNNRGPKPPYSSAPDHRPPPSGSAPPDDGPPRHRDPPPEPRPLRN